MTFLREYNNKLQKGKTKKQNNSVYLTKLPI